MQFSKKFPLPKNGSHLEFSNFCQKWQNTKFASISLTVRDIAISLKFSTHRVLEEGTRIFDKNGKTQFYYATIAYYVGLNAVLGWPHLGQRLRKKRHFMLAVESSCRHMITSDQSPYFLIGHD